MNTEINLQENQGLDIEVSTHGNWEEKSNVDVRLNKLNLFLYRRDAESLFIELDSKLHDETASNKDDEIENLHTEIDRLENKISDLASEIYKYENRGNED
jgi:hypothetical protein